MPYTDEFMSKPQHYSDAHTPSSPPKRARKAAKPHGVATLVDENLRALIKKIEAGTCTQRDIERVRNRFEKLGEHEGPLQSRLLKNAAFLTKNRANLHVVALESMRKAFAAQEPVAPAVTKPGRKRKASKGRLRIGVSDVELDKVPVVCQTGASITLSWDSRRKGFFILGAPHSEISIVPQGPNALVLRVR